MKSVKASYIGQSEKPIEGFLIEDSNDLEEYFKIIENNSLSCMTKMLTSKESIDRMDHVVPGMRPLEKALGALAVTRAKLGLFGTNNPIFQVQGSAETMKHGMRLFIVKGQSLFVNRNGGYTPITKGVVEIVERIENVQYKDKAKTPHIPNRKTKVINLENDYEMEDYSHNFITNYLNDTSYSIVYELRLWTKNELINIFKDFIKQGGETIYVYTTGRDVEQMYEYSSAAIEAGLQDFRFCFNSGTDKDIDNFVSWLSERAKVKLYEVEDRYRKQRYNQTYVQK